MIWTAVLSENGRCIELSRQPWLYISQMLYSYWVSSLSDLEICAIRYQQFWFFSKLLKSRLAHAFCVHFSFRNYIVNIRLLWWIYSVIMLGFLPSVMQYPTFSCPVYNPCKSTRCLIILVYMGYLSQESDCP